jgi:hypothetical protein
MVLDQYKMVSLRSGTHGSWQGLNRHHLEHAEEVQSGIPAQASATGSGSGQCFVFGTFLRHSANRSHAHT